MKKLIYFYLLLSLPCFTYVLWDMQRSIFAMEEGGSEEPTKAESSDAQQAKEKQIQTELLLEKKRLEEEKERQHAQQQQQAQTKQLPKDNSQKTPPSTSSSDVIAVEKAKKEREQEKEKEEAEALSKKLAAEFDTYQPPEKKKSARKEPSPLTICIRSLIIQNMAKAQDMFSNKANEDSFTELTNEMDSGMQQLIDYESDKIGLSYYNMTTNEVQARRNNALKASPKDKNYDQIYAQLIKKEQLIRTKVKQLIQEKTGAEVNLINTIVEGCANKRFINIITKGKEASEEILGEV